MCLRMVMRSTRILLDLLHHSGDIRARHRLDDLVSDQYRAQPGRRAVYNHGNTTLEIIWTTIPAAILIVLSFMSVSTWAKVKRNIRPAILKFR